MTHIDVLTVILVVVTAAAAGVAGWLLWVLNAREEAECARALIVPGVVERKLRARVIVTLKSGDTFEGVLVEADEDAWVLRSASAVGAADDRSDLPVDGEIILMSADIAYAQKP